MRSTSAAKLHKENVILGGHDLEGMDFPIVVNGTISGKVVDGEQEPVRNDGVAGVRRSIIWARWDIF